MAATLFHLGKAVPMSASTFVPGARAYFYRTATSTKMPIYTSVAMTIEHSNPVIADSFGKLPAIYLDQEEGNVKYVIAPANDSDPPASAFETVDPFIVSDPAQAALFAPDKTVAEIAAGIGTINSAWPPGDIRRYGAISDGSFDCASAWQAACAQASITSSPKGSPVYIPGSQQGWKISAGAAVIGTPFMIYGDNSYYSYVWSTADITPLTITNVHQNAGPVLRDFCFTKSGASTKPGLHVMNSSHGQIKGMLIRGFHTGVHMDPTAEPPSSDYLWSVEDSVIIENTAYGINAVGANFLSLRNVTLASQPIGIRLMDFAGFSWYGGDAESITNIAVDIDATAEQRAAVLITGVDFENCAGDSLIRIGNTAKIWNVTCVSNGMYNTSNLQYVINAQRVKKFTMIGDTANTGTLSGQWMNVGGAQVPEDVVVINNPQSVHAVEIMNGTLAYYDTLLDVPGFTGRHADAFVSIDYGTTCTPNAARGNWQTISIQDAVAFTIAAPTNPVKGQELTILIVNGSGGAHGAITWNAVYKLAGALPAIANGFNRSVTFKYSGTTWYEANRTAADVPN